MSFFYIEPDDIVLSTKHNSVADLFELWHWACANGHDSVDYGTNVQFFDSPFEFIRSVNGKVVEEFFNQYQNTKYIIHEIQNQ